MMSLRRLAILASAALAVLAAALPAAAGERYPDRSPWIIDLSIGLARYGMDDVNAIVRGFNEESSPEVGDMDEINSGPEFSVGVGRRLTPSLTAGLKFTRLDASTDLPNLTGAAEINAGANVWSVYAHYIPPMDGGMTYGVGLDLGLASTTGETNIAIPNQPVITNDMSGSAPAAAAYLVLDFEGTRTISFQGHAGYRVAKITDVPLGFADQVSLGDVDLSGFFIRAAFLFHP